MSVHPDKRGEDDLQLDEFEQAYTATEWAVDSDEDQHKQGARAGWILAMRWSAPARRSERIVEAARGSKASVEIGDFIASHTPSKAEQKPVVRIFAMTVNGMVETADYGTWVPLEDHQRAVASALSHVATNAEGPTATITPATNIAGMTTNAARPRPDSIASEPEVISGGTSGAVAAPSTTPQSDLAKALLELAENPDEVCGQFARGAMRKAASVLSATPCSADAKDAARFRFLQNLPVINAQMYFWHYESRKQRAAAIDAAMREAVGGVQP